MEFRFACAFFLSVLVKVDERELARINIYTVKADEAEKMKIFDLLWQGEGGWDHKPGEKTTKYNAKEMKSKESRKIHTHTSARFVSNIHAQFVIAQSTWL